MKLRDILNEINIEKPPSTPIEVFLSRHKQKLEQFIKDPNNRTPIQRGWTPDYGIDKNFTNDRPQYIGNGIAVLWKEPWHEEIAHGFAFKLLDKKPFKYQYKIDGWFKALNPEWEEYGSFIGRPYEFEGNYIYIAYVSVDPSLKKV